MKVSTLYLNISKLDRSIRVKVDQFLPKNLTIRYVGALLSLAALAILGQLITPTSVSRWLLLIATLLLLGIDTLYVLRPGVQSLYYALKTRSDFLGRMGHELRNPMHSILGMTQLLLETPLNESQRKYLTILNKSSTDLLETLNHLLDFSTLESSTQKKEEIPFELNKVIETSISHVTYAAQSNEVELEVDLSPSVPLHLIGDPQRLQQILTNLLGNAVKFTKKGKVTLKVECTAGAPPHNPKVLFSVIDTGIGIEKKKLTRIFDAFVQEDSSIRRRFGGAGLGLSISNDLVTLLGGRLAVESKKSQGSRFYFTLPFAIPSAITPLPIQTPQALEVPPSQIEPLNILVVDDSPDNQFLVHAYLSSLPYHLTFASNGQEALDHYKSSPFDLILMDLQMPELDGYSATKEIRKWERTHAIPRTPIVAVSAHDYDSIAIGLQQSGFTSSLTKPVSASQVRAKILEMMAPPAPFGSKEDLMIADLVPQYLEKREQEIKGLTLMLNESRFDQIQTLGHRLSGNAKSFGFEELGQLGKQLETAARDQDVVALQSLIRESSDYFSSLSNEKRRTP